MEALRRLLLKQSSLTGQCQWWESKKIK